MVTHFALLDYDATFSTTLSSLHCDFPIGMAYSLELRAGKKKKEKRKRKEKSLKMPLPVFYHGNKKQN